MVTLEVVARDHQGRPVSGLTANDFQVFEQIGWGKEKHPQKIAAFRALSVSEIAAQDKGKVEAPPGVYTNLVTMQKAPVPPTVLLIDGLNTDVASQMQVHHQMIRMLASIPSSIPVAVFLLGKGLRLLQDFTTDPKLLQSALQRASSLDAGSLEQVDPRDDPDALSAFIENVPVVRLEAIKRFERETFATALDLRVEETLDALRAIARHVAGYPGRKNLLWISSSFPITIDPGSAFGIEGMRNYQRRMEEVANELGISKIAVYPMDPSGLQIQSMFQAGNRQRGNMSAGSNAANAIGREEQWRISRQQAMHALAEQTGGQVCVNDNDLGDCVKKATDDGGFFYEISYYADSSNWHDEFHKVTVKVAPSGVRLAYRQGYYARPERGSDQKSADLELRQAACQDRLTATSVILAARGFPPDAAGSTKYVMVIDPNSISFALASDGSHELALQVAACALDKSGKPLQLVQAPVNRKLTDKEYSALMAQRGLLHTIMLPPVSGFVTVRLLVKDITTGRLGSVNVPLTETAPVAIFGVGSQSAH